MNRRESLVRGLILFFLVATGVAALSAQVGVKSRKAAPVKTKLREQINNLRTKAQSIETRFHSSDPQEAKKAQSNWASSVKNFESWLRDQNVPTEAKYRPEEAPSQDKGDRGGGSGGSGGGTGGSGGTTAGGGSPGCELTFERSNYFCWLVSYSVDANGKKHCQYKCTRWR